MKTFWLIGSFCLFFSISTIGQSLVLIDYQIGKYDYGGSAITTGLGEIGVVASENNYHSAYFQNPALLARDDYSFDVFVNLPASQLGFGTTSGIMANFNNNAIGIGLERLATNNSGHDVYIPILYARNLYRSKKSSISIGGNLNIHDKTIKTEIRTGIITEDINLVSGGFGIDAYRIAQLTKRQSIRVNAAFSINNLGQDVRSSIERFIPIKNYYKMGLLMDWKYLFSESKSLMLTMGFQFNQNPNSRTRHFGGEARYFWSKYRFVAIRTGFVWEAYRNYFFQRNYSIGAGINVKGVSINLAVIPEENRSFNSLLHTCVGYQAALNRKKKTVPPNYLDTL